MFTQAFYAPALPQRAARAAQAEPRIVGASRRTPALRSSMALPKTGGRRQSCVLVTAAASYSSASSAGESRPGGASPSSAVARMTPEQLEELQKRVSAGDNAVEGTVAVATKGGLIVRFENGSGFVPARQLDLSKLPASVPADAATRAADSKWLAEYIGRRLELVVIEGKVFLSERAASACKAMGDLKLDDVRNAEVARLTEYGAFCRLERGDGSGPLLGIEGLVHVSEISWSRLRFPSDGLKTGQKVKVKVIKLDTENRQVGLSIKQLLPDPIMETLDTVLPMDGPDAGPEPQGPFSELPLPGLMQIVEQMRAVEGITEVTLGRQATEQRVVSQDIELWMTNRAIEGGVSIVARMGRRVQELRVKTSLSRDDVKAVLRTISMSGK